MKRKRLLFIGWADTDLGMIEVMTRIAKRHDILYWSGEKAELAEFGSRFPGTILHDHYDALHGIPASGVDASAFPPPDAGLIARFSPCESTTLTMMNKRFERMLTSERKHLYYSELGYWHGILTTLRPDAVIFPCAPHTVYDYILYALAKDLSIRTIFFELTAVGARSLLMNDFVIGAPSLRRALAEPRANMAREDELPPDIRRYYSWQTDLRTLHTPQYLEEQLRSRTGIRFLGARLRSVGKTLIAHKDPAALLKVLTYVPRRFLDNMRTEYARVATRPDVREPFIFVPLGYQPERTTSPQGGVFTDQLLMVETLAASVPTSWRIMVKEHPAQWLHRGPDFFSYRYQGYYRRLAALRQVSVIPVASDTEALIARAAAVATVTSTAGWEAIMRGKPTMVFGYPWYQHAPGLLRVLGAQTATAAFAKIADGFAPSREDMLAYLDCFGRASFIGSCEPHGKELAGMSASENAAAIAGVLETELARQEL